MENYDNWSVRLSNHFDPALINDANWNELKEKLKIGDALSGTVVCRAHFGAWVDVGLGVPALLEIIYIDDLDPVEYRKGNWMAPGTEVSALVGCFRNDSKQIYLIQKGNWEQWKQRNQIE